VTDAGRPGLLPGLYLFLAALWAGALAFFAAAAGIVLKTAPTRADGGVVNRALLDVLDVASIVLASAATGGGGGGACGDDFEQLATRTSNASLTSTCRACARSA